MEKSFKDFIRLILPLSRTQRDHLRQLDPFLPAEDLSYVKYLLKQRKIGVSYEPLKINARLAKTASFPQVNKATEEKGVATSVNNWNDRIKRQAQTSAFASFAKKASSIIPDLVAPHIVGMDSAKLAVSWQLFSPERFHVLLLGDPGTGKTEILRGAAQFAPISSFGLGSGTSGAGLSAAKQGKKLVKGLLPRAHKGICCIDELNLMKSRDRGALLNAMEKGFVTYDKGTTHEQLPAEVRILATANPKGDRFVGNDVDFLKEQLPFDPALLSRFHLVFLVRRPTKEEFREITKNIIKDQQSKITIEDVRFVQDYIAFASKREVRFDPKLEPMITEFFDDLKEHEGEYLIELSPRLVLGVVRMAKAFARMQLKERVEKEHVAAVLETFKSSLIVSPDAIAKKRFSRK